MLRFRMLAAVLPAAVAIAGVLSFSAPASAATRALRARPLFGAPYATAARPKAGATFATIYAFPGVPGPSGPDFGNLIVVDGLLCGLTTAGGASYEGTAYGVSPSGKLRAFIGFTNYLTAGSQPYGGLIELNGALYGTTNAGGTGNVGTVFEISTAGERILHSFNGSKDGSGPQTSLTALNGTLYGTTAGGGAYNAGTVFAISPNGSLRTLYTFTNGLDGGYPAGGLTVLNGTLYGTTALGGTAANGTVFKISTSGSEKVIYNFDCTAEGCGPQGSLAALNGTLYGTTYGGGPYNGGTVYELSTSGSLQTLHNFQKYTSDGYEPTAGVTALNGILYGTTEYGGTGLDGLRGTVYSVTLSGSESVLHSFTGTGTDGQNPLAGLTVLNGALYGTTSTSLNGSGTGTIFELKP